MSLHPQSPASSRARRAPLLALLLAGACVGRPPADARGPMATAQRIAAFDFGRDAIEERTEHREMLQRWLGHAAARPLDWTRLPGRLRGEVLRAEALSQDLDRGARFELSRRPERLPPLLPGVHELTREVADDGDALLRFVWPDQPLGELDDRRHRTRYDDDHPEATILQRLQRRLRL